MTFNKSTFPISRDPPEGGTCLANGRDFWVSLRSFQFLGIPPKGELENMFSSALLRLMFPISRDPPEGGTPGQIKLTWEKLRAACFQFLGIPPKGELTIRGLATAAALICFQFLGIPPKGEQDHTNGHLRRCRVFPISRDPPEGGTVNNYPT